MSIPSYFHMTDGRLRLKVAEIKKSPEQACAAEELLSKTHGIDSAAANPLTGNILIYFDPENIDHNAIIELLRENGFLRNKITPRPALRLVTPNETVRRQSNYKHYQKIATDAAIQTLIEVAVQRAILALI